MPAGLGKNFRHKLEGGGKDLGGIFGPFQQQPIVLISSLARAGRFSPSKTTLGVLDVSAFFLD